MSTEQATVHRHQHPGAGRRNTKPYPKGRQVDPEALAEIRALLADRARDRDLLIEHLHLIQDHYGCVRQRHLVALADEMRLPMAEVYEVATFYAHFDVLADADNAPQLTIRVCDSLSCMLAGAEQLHTALAQAATPGVRVLRAPCMGRCADAPTVQVGSRHVDEASAEQVLQIASAGETDARIPPYIGFDDYHADGGYATLRACLDGQREFDQVAEALDASGLRGLGGAGFPTGRKWRIVRGFPGPRLLTVNADEGEPGTFKDRHYLESDPHRFMEGVLIAAWAVEAEATYIYLRDEYPAAHAILNAELAKLAAAGLTLHTAIHLRRGAGAYICGEESGMIESIEGKRGLPRQRPPYVAEVGLFGHPTLVQNVETLFWVRDILEKGPRWFADQGRHGGKGLRSYSVSGRVMEPGVKLAPAGITVRELIDEYCGGMAAGHTFKAYLPGGASGGILPARMGDLPLEFGALEEHGCFVGSHAVVILSEHDNLREVALNLMRFFEDESCGQCTPCRVGTEKAVKLMGAHEWDQDLLLELGQTMADASICGLGQAASNPLKSVLKYFPEELS